MSAEQEVVPLWKRCEDMWGRWLEADGHVVTSLSRAVGNTRHSEAPLVRFGGRAYRSPDLQSEKGQGKQFWEVKYRARPHVDPATGAVEHRVDESVFRDYVALDQLPGTARVSIVVYEEATATQPARWRVIPVQKARAHGRRASLPGNNGKQTDSWLWPADVMEVVPAPLIDSQGAELPLLSDDEPEPPRRASEFHSLERDLRAARAQEERFEWTGLRDDLTRGDRYAEGVAHDPAALLAALCSSLGIPARPDYSVTMIGGSGVDLRDAIGLLHYGIRLFLITEHEVLPSQLGLHAEAFRDARLLELGRAPGIARQCHWIVDGVIPDETPEWVIKALDAADRDGGINASQYRIVHAPAGADILVSAGAGTGKTETMAERLMFLMSTSREPAANGTMRQPGAGSLHLRDFAFITFTREAAREMRGRFARTMLLRRRMCPDCIHPIGNWLMQLGAVQSSTIHAFAKSILRRHGHSIGLSPAFRVSAQTMRLQSLFTESISRSLEDRIGSGGGKHTAPFHEWLKHITAVWRTLENHGVQAGTGEDAVDWGDSENPATGIVRDVILEVARSARELALKEQSVRTSQLVPLAKQAVQDAAPTSPIRHLFVDEFQDTDAGQLALILDIRKKFGASLFVVGDAKQGVYRFRGAEGNALKAAEAIAKIRGLGGFARFGLTRNFRSGGRLLDSLHPLFRRWGQEELLPYKDEDRLIPRRGDESSAAAISFQQVEAKSFASAAAAMVRDWRRAEPQSTIAVLCRRNNHAIKVQAALQALGISCGLEVGGRFFRCRAAREARALLEAMASPTDLSAVLELCETCWAGGLLKEARAPMGAGACDHWGRAIVMPMPWADRFAGYGASADFPRSDAEPLLKRVASIAGMVRRMSIPAVLAECSRTMTPEAFAGSELSDREHYRRCLDHLICLIDDAFGGGPATVHGVLEWLRLQIATNRDEDEPSPPEDVTVRALTVHKAKGQEFDLVLIPNTWTQFGAPEAVATQCSVLAHQDRQGLVWKWRSRSGYCSNTQDPALGAADRREIEKEETRLLYVAMTRARHRLLVFHPGWSRPDSWWGLLRKGGANP